MQQWFNAARIHYICAIGIYMPQEATIRTRSKAGQASMYVWLRWTDVCCTFDLTVPKGYRIKDFTTTTIPGLQFLESVSINVITTTTNQCCCCYGNKSCQQPKTIQITLLLKNSYSGRSSGSLWLHRTSRHQRGMV